MIMAVVCKDSKVSLFNLDSLKAQMLSSGQIVSEFTPFKTVFCHNKPVVDAVIPKCNNEIFITGSHDKSLISWSLRTGEMIKKFIFEESISAFCVVSFTGIILI